MFINLEPWTVNLVSNLLIKIDILRHSIPGIPVLSAKPFPIIHPSSGQILFTFYFSFDIAESTKNFSEGRIIPSRGLTMGQISEILAAIGFYPEMFIRELYEDQSLFLWYIVFIRWVRYSGCRCDGQKKTCCCSDRSRPYAVCCPNDQDPWR